MCVKGNGCVFRVGYLYHVTEFLRRGRLLKLAAALCHIKTVPLQTWSGPEGSRKLRLPDYVTTAQDGSRLSALRTGRFLPPRNTPGTHFC